jgi:hypothetical protein
VAHDGTKAGKPPAKAEKSPIKREPRRHGKISRLQLDLLLAAYKREGSARRAALAVGLAPENAREILAKPENQRRLEQINQQVLEKIVNEMVDDFKGLIPFTLDKIATRIADPELPYQQFHDLCLLVFQVTGMVGDQSKGGTAAPPPGVSAMFFVTPPPKQAYGTLEQPKLPPWKEAALHAKTINADLRSTADVEPGQPGTASGD